MKVRAIKIDFTQILRIDPIDMVDNHTINNNTNSIIVIVNSRIIFLFLIGNLIVNVANNFFVTKLKQVSI